MCGLSKKLKANDNAAFLATLKTCIFFMQNLSGFQCSLLAGSPQIQQLDYKTDHAILGSVKIIWCVTGTITSTFL